MKLSEVKGERTLDVIADIIEPIANIAEDEVAAELFKKKKPPKGVSAKKYAISRLKKSVPAIVRTHKNDLIAILAAIENVSATEYKESLNMAKIITDVTELLTDDEFVTLFISAQTGTDGGSSGSAPENSGADQ